MHSHGPEAVKVIEAESHPEQAFERAEGEG